MQHRMFVAPDVAEGVSAGALNIGGFVSLLPLTVMSHHDSFYKRKHKHTIADRCCRLGPAARSSASHIRQEGDDIPRGRPDGRQTTTCSQINRTDD